VNYLVTGAAGFIASKVCELLLSEGHTVVGFDNLNNYYDVRLKDYRLSRLLLDEQWRGSGSHDKSIYSDATDHRSDEPATKVIRQRGIFIFRHGDIENITEIETLFSEYKFDAVFNLAARAGVRASLENPHIYISTNVQGTLNILECQRKYRVSKLILASSSSLYAEEPLPFVESQPVNTPHSPYAASKKAAEMLAFSYHAMYNIDVTILRYFTVFGPAGRPDMSPFRFIRWIDEETPIDVFGSGDQSRDFTYIDDIAAGTISARKPLGYEIINLGGGKNPATLNTLIAVIERQLGKKAICRRKPAHSADMTETWADISKAKVLLNWEPTIALEEGIAKCIEWYYSNKNWIKDIRL